jgi:NTP pyrophosphatase (non-canonical NTP hydrolase)
MNGICTLNGYQIEARKTAVYPGQGTTDGLFYCVLGLLGEAGELANQLKKVIRDDGGELTSERTQKLWDEAGDCMWYMAVVAVELGVDLEWLANRNLRKLAERQQAGTIKGR